MRELKKTYEEEQKLAKKKEQDANVEKVAVRRNDEKYPQKEPEDKSYFHVTLLNEGDGDD